jgi:hypothetical protein
MNPSSRIVAVALLAAIVSQPVLQAVDGKKAEYIGGTVNGMPEETEGRLDTSNEVTLTFTPDKKDRPALGIPYDKITSIEYGQKAGRRVAVAVLVSPLALFSKKRKHFLTLSYTDTTGKEQAAVLELGKDIIRTTLTIVQTRSGKEIEYQDDEARKAGRGGN